MSVYHLPPQALAEQTYFSVSAADGSELLVIPQGCLDAPARFDGYIYLPWSQSEIFTAPITPLTLIYESMAEMFPQNPVIISSQICGGTLENRLKDALAQYGERTFFIIEPMCHLMTLPCPNADPQKITRAECESIRRHLSIHFTDAFCCNTCVNTASHTLLLYDTDITINEKIKLAESLCINRIVCLPT